MPLFERVIPEWGKNLDWGYLPLCGDTARQEVTCNYGERHFIDAPRCRSIIPESKTYGQQRIIQCEKPAGHDAEHYCMTGICYGYKWTDEQGIKPRLEDAK